MELNTKVRQLQDQVSVLSESQVREKRKIFKKNLKEKYTIVRPPMTSATAA